MFGISFAELFIIFLLVLIVMGPEKIPETARWIGKGMRELRKASNTLRNTLAMEDLDVDLDAPPKKRRITEERQTTSTAASTDGSAPSGKDSSPSQSPESESGITEPTPLTSGGLDQVDDQAFERMLEERYAAQVLAVRQVQLSPAGPAPDVFEVPIDAPLSTTDGTIDVDLPASIGLEVTS